MQELALDDFLFRLLIALRNLGRSQFSPETDLTGDGIARAFHVSVLEALSTLARKYPSEGFRLPGITIAFEGGGRSVVLSQTLLDMVADGKARELDGGNFFEVSAPLNGELDWANHPIHEDVYTELARQFKANYSLPLVERLELQSATAAM